LKKYPLNKVKPRNIPHGGTCSHRREGKRQTHANFACWTIKEKSILNVRSRLKSVVIGVLLSLRVFFLNEESKSIPPTPPLVKILTKIHFAVKPPFSNWETMLIFTLEENVSQAYLIPLVLRCCNVSEKQISHFGVK